MNEEKGMWITEWIKWRGNKWIIEKVLKKEKSVIWSTNRKKLFLLQKKNSLFDLRYFYGELTPKTSVSISTL